MTSLARALVAGVSVIALTAPAFAQSTLPQADDSYFLLAQEQLAAREAIQPNTGKAKNVIMFVVDGMSIPTITAARIHEGQLAGVDGATHTLAFETLLPHTALVKTYTHDSIVADSAPTATAITSGVKALNGTIGVDQTAVLEDCSTQAGSTTMSIFEQAEEAGLATGVVSTARITHATPAATYAHTVGRDWEADTNLPEDAVGVCADIASQLVDWSFGDGFEVVFGGGRSNFMLDSQADPEDETKMGSRKERDLVAEWQEKYADGTYVWNQEGFDGLTAETTKVLGLFNGSHMQYEADRATDAGGEPSIAEMTTKAIEILEKNEDGFVLMVEGGRVDHAHHAGNAARALKDAIAVSEAVQAAYDAVNPEETLILITADHSHVFSIAGYPTRDTDILGIAGEADDGKPYTILGYQNGPGATVDEARADLTDVDTTDIDFLQQALIPLGSETHAGDDIAIFAQGPQAYLFDGVIEQNMIYHVMAKALELNAAE
ncbi:MAG: alkaline phosphatase [Candidatus Devosia phytovorans]|uniref:Alkaline phosphatase n=1 Tax=Candidatus Devosia phytovorans TaxID=3121372 RepID=A0AAJ5VYL4_9HYPH|nr:alkaline phosphatase [Devosia sp.]WEK05913.1 MAG: alkaline phosphatase [Devosia sp.]